MCKTGDWIRIRISIVLMPVRIRIWIGINMEIRIRIRIGIKSTPIHNTAEVALDPLEICLILTVYGRLLSKFGRL